MTNLILVGGGGFFLELSEYIQTDINTGNLESCHLAGFIDDDPGHCSDQFNYLGTIEDYTPQLRDQFLLAIGSVVHRYRLFHALKTKGAKFFTYIHPSAFIAATAKLGDGVVVCPFSTINAHAEVSNNTLVNVGCSVGHESIVGESCVLSPGSIINGAAKLGARSFMGTRSTVFPAVTVGEQSVIDTHSYAKSDVDSHSIVSLHAEYKVVKNRLLK